MLHSSQNPERVSNILRSSTAITRDSGIGAKSVVRASGPPVVVAVLLLAAAVVVLVVLVAVVVVAVMPRLRSGSRSGHAGSRR